MSFSLMFLKKSVPQWKLCYYDYVEVYELIVLCRKAYAIRCNIEDLAKQDSYALQDNSMPVQNKQVLEEIKNRRFALIDQIAQAANILFYKYHSLNKRVVFVFLQFKIHQLNARLQRYAIWQNQVDETKHYLTKLLSNCFAETLKLEELTSLHIKAYEKIYNKHQLNFHKFQLTTPSLKTARLVRSLEDYKRLEQKVSKIIESNKEIVAKQTQHKLRWQIEPSPFKVSFMSYMFGLLNGFSVCTMIAAIILLAVNLNGNNQSTQALTVERLTFSNQYKLWKCTGFMTIFAWVFAISFYIYERKRINYPLILQYEHHVKKSSRILTGATLSLLLWSSFFVFYAMDLLGIYEVATVSSNPEFPITIFFPLIIIGLFLITFIAEFIWTRRGTVFFLLVLLKIILSLFGFYEMTFNVIWATQQLLSLLETFSDFVYTICYYSRMLKTPASPSNYCFSYGFRIIPECVGIFLYSIRVFQCIKLAMEKKKIIGTHEMYRLIRAVLYISLASLSIAVVDGNSWAILWVWVGIGIANSLYSIVIDIFLDWHLYHFENGKIVRKQNHIFSKGIIIFMVAFNFIARFSFLVTLSANLIFTFVPNPEIITTIAGYIELGRRLVWNMLRIENEQIKNNFFFQIRTDYEKNQEKIMEELSSKSSLVTVDKLGQTRTEQQLALLRNMIREKVAKRQEILSFCQKNHKILQDIEDDGEIQIKQLIKKEQ